MRNKFAAISRAVSDYAGRPVTFVAACALILVWGACGPLFGFSDTWQLIINTGTTIVTFLMVFLIQSSQNTDTKALHLKLDELIRTSEQASNKLISIERKP
jgi:low affinity Fe/Cu permease